MTGSDCTSATRDGANGVRPLTYGSGARSGASETKPTYVPVLFRAGADTIRVSGERSTGAPPSAGSTLSRDTVPRASLTTTPRESPVHPTIVGRWSKLSARGRVAPSAGETSTTRKVSAYAAGATQNVTTSHPACGVQRDPPFTYRVAAH